jgi:hypothetical protein
VDFNAWRSESSSGGRRGNGIGGCGDYFDGSDMRVYRVLQHEIMGR